MISLHLFKMQCEKCSRYFKSPETLQSHQAFHARQEKKTIGESVTSKRKVDLDATQNGFEKEKKKFALDNQQITRKESDRVESNLVDKESFRPPTVKDDTVDNSVTTHIPLPFALTANRL